MTIEQLCDALSKKITSVDQLKALNISSIGTKLVPGYTYTKVGEWCADWDGAEVQNGLLPHNRIVASNGAARRPQLDTGWWVIREWLRMLAGVYPEPTEAMMGLKANFLAQYALHISKDDPNMVAYTASPEDGRNDRQVRTSFGKFLRKFCWFMSDAEVQRLEAQHRADMSTELELLPGSQIRESYLNCHHNGLRSCMTHSSSDFSLHESVHPTDAYNAPGFHLAVMRGSGNALTARCIVWHNPDNPQDKRAVRVYGDGALKRRLIRAGYTFRDLDGAKLAVVPALMTDGTTWDAGYKVDEGTEQVVCVPYLDGVDGNRSSSDAQYIAHMGDHLKIVRSAEAQQYSELAAQQPDTRQGWAVYTGRASGGRVGLRIFKPEWRTYVCAATGQTMDTLEHPPTLVLIGGELKPMSTTNGIKLVTTYHDGQWRLAKHEGEPTFEHYLHSGLPDNIIDNTTNRAQLGYKRLWEKHYPDAQWQRHTLAVVHDLSLLMEDGDNVTTHYAELEDVVCVLLDGSPRQVHKADVPENATRVADYNGRKTWALGSTTIVRTDSGRKVVPGVHDVTQLGDGTWTYDRNVERTVIVHAQMVVAHHKSQVAEGGSRLWDYLCMQLESNASRDPRLLVADTMIRLRSGLALDADFGRVRRTDRSVRPANIAESVSTALKIHHMTPEELVAAYPATAMGQAKEILAVARDFALCAEFLDGLAETGMLDDRLNAGRYSALRFIGGYCQTVGDLTDANGFRVSPGTPMRVCGGDINEQTITVRLDDGYATHTIPASQLVPVVPGMPHLTPALPAVTTPVEAADEQFAVAA